MVVKEAETRPVGLSEADHTAAVARLADISNEGLAVLDRERRFVYLNHVGARILQVQADRIIGQPALIFDASEHASIGRGEEHRSTTQMPSAEGARVIEHSEHRGQDETLVVFRDVTDVRRRERQLAAFAQTATTLAESRRLKDVLDDVARAILEATGTPACTIVLYDEATQRFDQIGTAGGYPDDYVERLEGCRRRGAPLASLAAFRSRKPFVAPDWARSVLADPRWAPMHPVIRGRDWAALSAIPLASHDRVIGALTTFYRRGQPPLQSDVAFLSSIASLVAVSVGNQRLMVELEAKAMVEERNRIARELHDSVSQALFSLSLRSRALWLANERESPGRRERVRAGLEEIQELTSHVLNEMRALIFQLRPTELLGVGIVDAISRHVAAVSARDDLEIVVEGAPDLPSLSGDAELHIFRIVQEALNNVIRHSKATHARIALSVRRDRDTLDVIVQDDGDGFDPSCARPGHIGLRSMRERCEQLGGSLTVSSRPGRTHVRATIALDSSPAASGAPDGALR